jgi:hypothetical protein
LIIRGFLTLALVLCRGNSALPGAGHVTAARNPNHSIMNEEVYMIDVLPHQSTSTSLTRDRTIGASTPSDFRNRNIEHRKKTIVSRSTSHGGNREL